MMSIIYRCRNMVTFKTIWYNYSRLSEFNEALYM